MKITVSWRCIIVLSECIVKCTIFYFTTEVNKEFISFSGVYFNDFLLCILFLISAHN